MLPEWDDGTETQSDFQLAEFLRTVDPDAVARDRRRIHIESPTEARRRIEREHREVQRRAARIRTADNEASRTPEALDRRTAPHPEGTHEPEPPHLGLGR